MQNRLPRVLHGSRPFAAWIGIGLVLHAFWETAQPPLYTIWLHPDKRYIAFAVIHCLGGDLAISVGTYAVAAVATRDLQWVLTRPARGLAVALPIGLIATAASEWHNVYRAGNSQYLPAMPLLVGIGLSPLLQWVLVPAATVFLSRGWAWTRSRQ